MTAYAVESAKDGRTVTVCQSCLEGAGMAAPELEDATTRDERTGAKVRRLTLEERVGRTCAGCKARIASALEHGYPCWKCSELFDPSTTTGTVYGPCCIDSYHAFRAQRELERHERLEHQNDRLTP